MASSENAAPSARSTANAWILYSILRIASFIIPFIVVWWAGLGPYIAGIAGLILSLLISYLFLDPLRRTMIASLANRTPKKSQKQRHFDVDDEDDEIDDAVGADAEEIPLVDSDTADTDSAKADAAHAEATVDADEIPDRDTDEVVEEAKKRD
jgi:hypothetical protein